MFYLIDKPLGISSFDVLRQMRKILGIRKIGHTGTLDPLATGLLLMATGNSTKLIRELDNVAKRYRFTVRLDGKTPSLDRGTPIESVDISLYISRTPEELRDFLTAQKRQIPPKYSALHVDGKRAYDLARSGEIFELQERSIRVSDTEIHQYSPPDFIDISLTISSGGYIRSFAPLIGHFFGGDGGYISTLRRTHMFLNDRVTLDEWMITNLENPSAISYSQLFPTIHTINISEQVYTDLLNGKNIILEKTVELTPWGKYFLKYGEIFLSLCQYDREIFTIIRNNV